MTARAPDMATTVKLSDTLEPSDRPFFPDLFAIEACVALAMLAALIILAHVTSAALEPVASRQAAGYVPRPEWYFLWLFELLKYFKGSLEPVGTALVPTLLIVLLLAVPFIDRRPPKTRPLIRGTRPVRIVPRIIAAVFVAVLLALTIVAVSSQQSTTTTAPTTIPTWPPQSSIRHEQGARPCSICAVSTTTGRDDVRIA